MFYNRILYNNLRKKDKEYGNYKIFGPMFWAHGDQHGCIDNQIERLKVEFDS